MKLRTTLDMKTLAEIAKFYARGHSLRETATEFGLSIDGVRVPLRKHYPKLLRPAHLHIDREPTLRPEMTKRRKPKPQRRKLSPATLRYVEMILRLIEGS